MEARDRREESRGLACLRRLAGRERREAAGIAAGAEARREQIGVTAVEKAGAASSSRRHCECRWVISRARVRRQAARRRSWVGIDGMAFAAGLDCHHCWSRGS